MSTTTKKRIESAEEDIASIIDELSTLFTNIENLVGWSYYRSLNHVIYLSEEEQSRSSRISDIKHLPSFSKIYNIRTIGPYETDYGVIDGSLTIFYQRNVNVNGAIVCKTHRGNHLMLDFDRIGVRYEYPPCTVASTLFFLLNPEVVRYIDELAENYLGSDDREALESWRYIYRRVTPHRFERNVPSVWDKLDSYDTVNSSLDLSEHPKFRVLVSVGTESFSIADSEPIYMYSIVLRKGSEVLKYYMKGLLEMKYIVEAFVPSSEMRDLAGEVQYVLSAVRKVPVVIGMMEGLDEDWFKIP